MVPLDSQVTSLLTELLCPAPVVQIYNIVNQHFVKIENIFITNTLLSFVGKISVFGYAICKYLTNGRLNNVVGLTML